MNPLKTFPSESPHRFTRLSIEPKTGKTPQGRIVRSQSQPISVESSKPLGFFETVKSLISKTTQYLGFKTLPQTEVLQEQESFEKIASEMIQERFEKYMGEEIRDFHARLARFKEEGNIKPEQEQIAKSPYDILNLVWALEWDIETNKIISSSPGFENMCEAIASDVVEAIIKNPEFIKIIGEQDFKKLELVDFVKEEVQTHIEFCMLGLKEVKPNAVENNIGDQFKLESDTLTLIEQLVNDLHCLPNPTEEAQRVAIKQQKANMQKVVSKLAIWLAQKRSEGILNNSFHQLEQERKELIDQCMNSPLESSQSFQDNSEELKKNANHASEKIAEISCQLTDRIGQLAAFARFLESKGNSTCTELLFSRMVECGKLLDEIQAAKNPQQLETFKEHLQKGIQLDQAYLNSMINDPTVPLEVYREKYFNLMIEQAKLILSKAKEDEQFGKFPWVTLSFNDLEEAVLISEKCKVEKKFEEGCLNLSIPLAKVFCLYSNNSIILPETLEEAIKTYSESQEVLLSLSNEKLKPIDRAKQGLSNQIIEVIDQLHSLGVDLNKVGNTPAFSAINQKIEFCHLGINSIRNSETIEQIESILPVLTWNLHLIQAWIEIIRKDLSITPDKHIEGIVETIQQNVIEMGNLPVIQQDKELNDLFHNAFQQWLVLWKQGNYKPAINFFLRTMGNYFEKNKLEELKLPLMTLYQLQIVLHAFQEAEIIQENEESIKEETAAAETPVLSPQIQKVADEVLEFRDRFVAHAKALKDASEKSMSSDYQEVIKKRRVEWQSHGRELYMKSDPQAMKEYINQYFLEETIQADLKLLEKMASNPELTPRSLEKGYEEDLKVAIAVKKSELADPAIVRRLISQFMEELEEQKEGLPTEFVQLIDNRAVEWQIIHNYLKKDSLDEKRRLRLIKHINQERTYLANIHAQPNLNLGQHAWKVISQFDLSKLGCHPKEHRFTAEIDSLKKMFYDLTSKVSELSQSELSTLRVAVNSLLDKLNEIELNIHDEALIKLQGLESNIDEVLIQLSQALDFFILEA